VAEGRNIYAFTRTRLSFIRTELAKGRTALAIIRTGLAFLVLGISLFRYFGLSWWTIFDGALAVVSLFMVTFGAKGYFASIRAMNKLLTGLDEKVLARS
jgi:uncharacterized membrane protein YidH (DUF202 family)